MGNQSVARAVLVLDALGAARGDMEMGVTELSEVTGLAKSVVSRTLTPLVAGGYVERNDRTRRYRIGVRMFEMGLRYLRRSGEREAALTLLQALARETGATSYLGVLEGAECVVLAAMEGSDRLRVVVTAGDRMPVQATAMGKAMMAALDEQSLQALLSPSPLDGAAGDAGASAVAPRDEGAVDVVMSRGAALGTAGAPASDVEESSAWHTLSPGELRNDIEAARERGYAITRVDGYPGVWSVGAALPVQGETLMAISVDLPAFAATEEQLHDLGRLLEARASRFAETAWTGMLI